MEVRLVATQDKTHFSCFFFIAGKMVLADRVVVFLLKSYDICASMMKDGGIGSAMQVIQSAPDVGSLFVGWIRLSFLFPFDAVSSKVCPRQSWCRSRDSCIVSAILA